MASRRQAKVSRQGPLVDPWVYVVDLENRCDADDCPDLVRATVVVDGVPLKLCPLHADLVRLQVARRSGEERRRREAREREIAS